MFLVPNPCTALSLFVVCRVLLFFKTDTSTEFIITIDRYSPFIPTSNSMVFSFEFSEAVIALSNKFPKIIPISSVVNLSREFSATFICTYIFLFSHIEIFALTIASKQSFPVCTKFFPISVFIIVSIYSFALLASVLRYDKAFSKYSSNLPLTSQVFSYSSFTSLICCLSDS